MRRPAGAAPRRRDREDRRRAGPLPSTPSWSDPALQSMVFTRCLTTASGSGLSLHAGASGSSGRRRARRLTPAYQNPRNPDVRGVRLPQAVSCPGRRCRAWSRAPAPPLPRAVTPPTRAPRRVGRGQRTWRTDLVGRDQLFERDNWTAELNVEALGHLSETLGSRGSWRAFVTNRRMPSRAQVLALILVLMRGGAASVVVLLSRRALSYPGRCTLEDAHRRRRPATGPTTSDELTRPRTKPSVWAQTQTG